LLRKNNTGEPNGHNKLVITYLHSDLVWIGLDGLHDIFKVLEAVTCQPLENCCIESSDIGVASVFLKLKHCLIQ
jgi:hypothetical protein